jgi:hypothetical protein
MVYLPSEPRSQGWKTAIREQSDENDIECLPPEAEFENFCDWDQEVAHGL